MTAKRRTALAVVLCGILVAACAGAMAVAVPVGRWGGKGIALVVTETTAKLEYDCAVGTVDEPILPDSQGNFEARGIHVFERGGPRRLGERQPPRHRAVYRGWTDGREMRLSVTLPDSRRDVGSFILALGRPPELEKCL